jgi:hypothetical protein
MVYGLHKNAVLKGIKSIFLIWLLAAGINGFAEADIFEKKFAEKPKHAVLYIIDGLSYKTWDRVSLPVLGKMIKNGTLVEKNYLPTSAHPTEGAYAELHTCSIPNPVMMAGTVFITKETIYLPQMFFPEEVTAFVANTEIYSSLNRFYHYSYQKLGPDEEGVAKALEFMDMARPVFMRVHLQEVGEESFQIMSITDDVPWRGNIWAQGSPYVKRLRQADKLLGDFLHGLEDMGLLEETVILVMGDHGEADSGYHPPQIIDASITSIILWGAGIKKGVRVPYAEHIDVVPTVCELMEKKPPETCQGRVLAEALVGFHKEIPPREKHIKVLLDQFRSYRKKTSEASFILENVAASPPSRFFRELNHIRQDFYDIQRFADWPKFKTLDKLLAHNQDVLAHLDVMLNELRNLK